MKDDTSFDLRVVLRSALDHPIPSGPAVVYLFNPFRGAVMRRFVAELDRSLAAEPRDLYVVYYNPTCEKVLDSSASLRRVAEEADYVIYRSRAA